MVGDQICAAIRDKKVVRFYYKMELRTVEPHTLGYRKSELELCAWQTSGPKPGFRDFRVGKLSALSITAATFAKSRPGYNRDDSTMDRILCRL